MTKPPKLDPATEAVVRRMLATPPQPKKPVKKRKKKYIASVKYEDISLPSQPKVEVKKKAAKRSKAK